MGSGSMRAVRPALLALSLASLFPLACAHRPLAVLLSFGVCPLTRAPDGQKVEGGEGGAEVAANVSTDVAPGLRTVARGRFPGACTVELAPGGLPLLACRDRQAGVRYVLAWTRPKARALVLERREYAIAAGETAVADPTARRPLAELSIDRTAWVRAAPRQSCNATTP
jgi:hypothetical protein